MFLFFVFCFFYGVFWTEIKCFLNARMARLPKKMDYCKWAFLLISKLTDQTLIFTCTGVVKLFFFFSSFHLETLLYFVNKKKYVALFTEYSGFHTTVQSSC